MHHESLRDGMLYCFTEIYAIAECCWLIMEFPGPPALVRHLSGDAEKRLLKQCMFAFVYFYLEATTIAFQLGH